MSAEFRHIEEAPYNETLEFIARKGVKDRDPAMFISRIVGISLHKVLSRPVESHGRVMQYNSFHMVCRMLSYFHHT